MFTGIVQEVGEVVEVAPEANGARIVVQMPLLAPEDRKSTRLNSSH